MDPVLEEFGAMLQIHKAKEGANPESEVSCVDDVVIPTHAPEEKGINMAPEFSSETGEVCATARTDRMGNDVTVEPSSQSAEHRLSMPPESIDVEGAVGKDSKEGMMDAETACADSDSIEGSVNLEVLNVQPIVVQGSALGPIVQDLENLMLPEQLRDKNMQALVWIVL
ncbi:hypothetical protein Cgig2_005519 [Carnegiea gigantea]|uniref:Uncharacterized protein n=1 Tax=Carnegiea gigantea TaxID=171969 RepID=A0A9Q1JSN6_9CARY|nr:hypothetical protein Cgig2_005519 [Carnegiea gigantea]